jgi:putative peptidoglycan lipid II flippase
MKPNQIIKGALGFASGTMLSRVLGFGREMMFAYLFGAGMMMDAFRVAFRIPNLLRDLLAEGTLTPAFLPVFSDYHTREGKERAGRFVSVMLGAMLVVTGVITILGISFAPMLVKLVSFGFTKTPDKYLLTVRLTRIMFPFLMFISIGALIMGVLNFFGRFFVTGSAPCCFNIAVIGCGLLFSKRLGIQSIALGAVIGGGLQLAYQLPFLRKEGYARLPVFRFDKDVRKVFILMLPIALGYGASKINVIVNTLIASFLGHGVISWLGYAFEIMWIPVGVVGVALANVTLPFASRELSAENRKEFVSTLRNSLRHGALAGVAMAIGLWVFAHPVCRLIYQRGSFSAQDTLATAQALRFYCFGIPGLVLTRILATGFYALKETKKPMLASFIAVAVNMVAAITLVRVMGFKGIPLAASISGTVNMLVLAFLSRGRIFLLDNLKKGDSFSANK